MFRPPVRVLFEAAQFLFALGLGATAAFGPAEVGTLFLFYPAG